MVKGTYKSNYATEEILFSRRDERRGEYRDDERKSYIVLIITMIVVGKEDWVMARIIGAFTLMSNK